MLTPSFPPLPTPFPWSGKSQTRQPWAGARDQKVKTDCKQKVKQSKLLLLAELPDVNKGDIESILQRAVLFCMGSFTAFIAVVPSIFSWAPTFEAHEQ